MPPPRSPHQSVRLLLPLLLLLGPCAVGPAVAKDREPRKPSATRPIAVRVITYNAWLIPFFSKQYEERRGRLPNALASFRSQVICLQEVWSPDDQHRLHMAMKKTHPHAARAKGGLLVLSRFPIASSRFTAYPVDEKLTLQERLAGKGYLTVMLRTPAGPLEVVTTHLAAMWGEDSPRAHQLALLIGHLKTKRPHPLILAGDLNTPPVAAGRLAAEYKPLLGAGLTNVNPPTDRGDGTLTAGRSTRVGWPRRPKNDSTEWVIDYILYRSSPQTRVKQVTFQFGLDAPETALSDHQLLLGDLRIEPQAKAPAAKRKDPPR